jgi:hypothetical protein
MSHIRRSREMPSRFYGRHSCLSSSSVRFRSPTRGLSPQAEPSTATPYRNVVSEMVLTRTCPADPPGEMPGQRASYGPFAAVDCVREHGRKRQSNPTATFFEKEGPRARWEPPIAAFGTQDRVETWAILRSNRHDLEVGEHSVNPCLVAGARKVISGRNPQLRVPKGQICSGSLVHSTAEVGKPDGVLTIASRWSLMTALLRRETGDTDRGQGL